MRVLTDFLRARYAHMRAKRDEHLPTESTRGVPSPATANSDATQFEQARALHQGGQLQEAEAIYRALLQNHPKDFDLLHSLGMALGQRNDFTAAVSFIEQAIAINSNNAAAYRSRGNALMGLGKHEEALISYDAALALEQDDANTLSNRGVALKALGRIREARESYDRALAVDPNHLFALDNMGIILREFRRPEDALAIHDRALRIRPEHASAHYNRGLALADLKRYTEACGSYREALRLSPDNGDALTSLGIALGHLGRIDAALACHDRALTIKPDDPIVLCNRGAALAGLGRLEEALASFERASLMQPDFIEALVNSGTTLRALNRNTAALNAFDKALALKPNHAIAHYNRGVCLADMGRHNEALACYDRSLALDPGDPDAHCSRGYAQLSLKRCEEAIEGFEQALSRHPAHVAALMGLGTAYRELNRHALALQVFERAIKVNPDNAVAYYNLGVCNGDMKQYEAALASYDRALALQPGHVEAHNNRGVILGTLRRYEEALSSHGRALAIDPDHRPALFSRGYLLMYLRRTERAIADFEKLVALQPDYGFALSHLLHAKMSCCAWADLHAMWTAIVEGTQQGKKLAEPFSVLALSTSAQFLRRVAETYAAERFPPAADKLPTAKPRYGKKIRLGYVSGEFRHHATSFLLAGLFERHDTQRFELFAFDNGWDDHSDIRNRLNNCFTEIVEITRLGDREAAAKVREIGIDILIDLNGHVGLGRPGLFSYRPSAIQVNWLGFPGTMGVDYIDYIIGDASVIPAGQEMHYAEKVVRLPDSYQANDSNRAIAARAPSRAEVNLPQSGFVFCCFNNNYKITPEVFKIWMTLLGKVDDSVLWLLEDNPAAPRNLRAQAQAFGIAPDRLVFAPRMALPDHLARQRLADLFLDTLPCNAHTTASDALWAGLPLVTCMGSTFAGRVAGSLLRAVGLPELITENLAAYEALALKLATTPQLLAKLRTRLADNRTTHPLFDSVRFARHMESAYVSMVERWSRGEAPESFAVQSLPK